MLKDILPYVACAIIASVLTLALSGHGKPKSELKVSTLTNVSPEVKHLVYSSQADPTTLVFSDSLYSD